MLHSDYFNGIWKKNKGVKGVRFKFATVAVFFRRVLDKMGLYSKADVENDITCAIKQDFDEFDITVEFMHFIRPEVHFDDMNKLKKQVDEDKIKAMKYHGI